MAYLIDSISNCEESMTIDLNKRSSMKKLVAATGVLAAPAVLNASPLNTATHSVVSEAVSESVSLRGTGLVISLADHNPVTGRRKVVIRNITNKDVTLSHVYPGIVSTSEGNYDLNELLASGPKVFNAQQTGEFTLSAVQNKPVERKLPAYQLQTANAEVVTTINNGQSVSTTRQLFV